MRRALVRAPALQLSTALTLAVSVVPIGVYLWLAGHRIGYPYELDWLEGGTVELVRRVMDGHGLYSAPSLSYVGFTYTPLYSLVAAAVAEVVGIGFLPLRIVSVASSLAVMVLLAAYVRDAAGDWIGGAVAAAIFAACYTIGGDAFDVGRGDSMFLALSLLTLWLGRRAGSVRGGLVLGLVAFLAFFTKQTGLIVVLPALVVLTVQHPRVGVAALGVLLGLVLLSTLILDAATGGWYRYYILSELAGQPVIVAQYGLFWTGELGKHLWPVLLLGLGATATVTYRTLRSSPEAGTARSECTNTPIRRLFALARWRQAPGVYDLAAAAGLLVAAWISIIHSGGWLNVLMPAYAAAAGIGGVAYSALARRGWVIAVAGAAVLALQFALLLNGAGVALPTRADRVGGAELTAALKRLPGPVLVLRHPWYGTEAGKGSFAQSDGIAEVLRSKGKRGASYLRHALRGSLNRDDIQAVVLDGPPPSWLAPQLAADFREAPGTITATKLRPPRDYRSAPTYLYLRIRG